MLELTINKNLLWVVICVLFAEGLLAAKEEVSFRNGEVRLSGTLYKPKSQAPFPVVVFVHGSGEETRQNSIQNARMLNELGIAALVYDKRGTGKSSGNADMWRFYSFEDLAGDVEAAVAFLAARADIDSGNIGIHASSQGGWVASLAASSSPHIHFLIMKSTSVTTVLEDNMYERRTRLVKEGFDSASLEEVAAMQKLEGAMGRDEAAYEAFVKRFEANKSAPWFSRVYGFSDPRSKGVARYFEWYATVAGFDPLPLLKQLQMPVLWIYGDPDKDHLGPVETSLKALTTLKKQGLEYTIVQIPEAGHNISMESYLKELADWMDSTIL